MDNYECFNDYAIKVVIPRTYSLEDRVYFAKFYSNKWAFVSFSLDETIQLFIKKKWDCGLKIYICIDLANGHMKKLIDTIAAIKKKYGSNVVIMSGNIANPKTYELYEKAGADYVRVSIGTGDLCCTASNTGIFYPAFSLLKETYEVKKQINGKCRIIADGGIKGYRDIQKALLYADEVMIGSLFNRAIESAGKTTYGASYFKIFGHKVLRPIKSLFQYGKTVPKRKYKKVLQKIKDGTLDVWKECYGMSTKVAQKEINEANGIEGKKHKTAEGIVKKQKVEYSIAGWVENEIDFLRSAMSYTDSRNLKEYKDSNWVKITEIKYNK
jgi:IMP dehydrogenase/GMP reductase